MAKEGEKEPPPLIELAEATQSLFSFAVLSQVSIGTAITKTSTT